MRIAMDFSSPEQGFWALEGEKGVHGGSAHSFLRFAKQSGIDTCRLYCHPGNATAYLLLQSSVRALHYQVLSPRSVSPDPIVRLKSLFACHASSVVLNRTCRAIDNESVAWYLAVPDMDDKSVSDMLREHVAWPFISFFPNTHMPSLARLIGEILQPSRFGTDDKVLSRLCQFLRLNPHTALQFTQGGELSPATRWAYESWGAGARLTDIDMVKPAALIHRIAEERGVLRATKTWIKLLVAYWSQVEIDPTLCCKASHFLARNSEIDALQSHLDSVIAPASETR